MLENNKLGLPLLNKSEFVEIIDTLLTLTEEDANVNKLTKFKISGEKSSQKFFRSVKKVNKLECSKNLPLSSCLDVSLVQNFLSSLLFVRIFPSISLSKWTSSFTNHCFKSSDSYCFSKERNVHIFLKIGPCFMECFGHILKVLLFQDLIPTNIFNRFLFTPIKYLKFF